MTYRGKVKNGVIVIDSEANLREGQEVEVVVLEVQHDSAATSDRTWAEVFKDVIGSAKGFPPDSSQNHDHYLYGTPEH